MKRTAYQALGDAMDAADLAGTPAPCKDDPALWSSDLLAISTQRDLADACRTCPALDACKAYKLDARQRGLKLTGVIAGVYMLLGHETRRTLRVGTLTLDKALELHQAGQTYAQIALVAGVSEHAVYDAFKRMRDRAAEAAA